MIEELKKLRELTEALTGNGYLRDQAEEWEYALNSIPEFVYIIDTQYNLKFVNRVLAQRLDISKEELYNKKCYEVISGLPPNGTNKPCNLSTEVCDIKNTDSFSSSSQDIFIEKLKGWFIYGRSPIYTKNSKLIGFICILRDVTERRRLEEETKKRKKILDTIFSTVPACIGLFKKSTLEFIAINDFMCKLLDYREEELIGKHISMVFKSKEELERVCSIRSKPVTTQFIGRNNKVVDVLVTNNKTDIDDEVVFTAIDMTDYVSLKCELEENSIKLTNARNDLKNDLKVYTEKVDDVSRVLIVEDNDMLSSVFSKFIEDLGFEIRIAGTGEQAVDLIERNGICLVLVDLTLPGNITGFDIIRKVSEYNDMVPIIVISGTSSVNDVDEAMRAGAWDYLAKPVSKEVFLKTIRRNLKQSLLLKKSKRVDAFIELTN